METTFKLLIALLVAYAPFFWYFISYWIYDARKTEAEKRKQEQSKPKQNTVEWWDQ